MNSLKLDRLAVEYRSRGHEVSRAGKRLLVVRDREGGSAYRVYPSGRIVTGSELKALLESEAAAAAARAVVLVDDEHEASS